VRPGWKRPRPGGLLYLQTQKSHRAWIVAHAVCVSCVRVRAPCKTSSPNFPPSQSISSFQPCVARRCRVRLETERCNIIIIIIMMNLGIDFLSPERGGCSRSSSTSYIRQHSTDPSSRCPIRPPTVQKGACRPMNRNRASPSALSPWTIPVPGGKCHPSAIDEFRNTVILTSPSRPNLTWAYSDAGQEGEREKLEQKEVRGKRASLGQEAQAGGGNEEGDLRPSFSADSLIVGYGSPWWTCSFWTLVVLPASPEPPPPSSHPSDHRAVSHVLGRILSQSQPSFFTFLPSQNARSENEKRKKQIPGRCASRGTGLSFLNSN
jgi:hypothetical protein